jgi:uncharacterized membrane protein
MGAAFGRRVKANAALFRRWFQYWRKRYVWLRLAIIVLIFAEPVYGVFHPLIRELVAIAIKGIETAKPGPRRYVDYYQFEDKKRLQKHLLTHFDANRDGRLERGEAARLRKETGLAPRQVTGSGLRVELDPLLEANRKLKLVPAKVTSRGLRREALDRALAEMDRQHKESHAEIDPMMAMQYPGWRDYLKWGTWKRGLDRFRGGIWYLPGIGVGRYFAGLAPRGEEYGYFQPAPAWQGLIGWFLLALIVVLCVVRYGKGEVLRKRFEEDSEFALAPCLICRTPTHDYGALIAHRGARAWAAAAVVGLGAGVLAVVTAGQQVVDGLHEESVQTVDSAIPLIIAIAVAAGVLRWLLWPREVHAVHRKPWLSAVGFGAGTVLVVGLVGTVASFTISRYRPPRAAVTVLGGRPRAMQGPRRASEERMRAAMAAARATSSQSVSRGLRGRNWPAEGGRGPEARMGANRARGAMRRAQREKRLGERRARLGSGQRGRRGERGTRRGM